MRNEHQQRIASASNLSELRSALVSIEAETESLSDVVDLSSLPTFGGDVPSNTADIWSWDETSLLIGQATDGSNWGIVARTEATWLPEYKQG